MEDTTTPSSETSSAKKRAAAERDQDCSSATGTPGSGFHDDDEIQEPCGKKQKLTKKELLEQAKARLKEAQEKKKMLQQKLEEEKANAEAEQQCWDDYPPYHHYGGSYFEEEYYYEYHIPPVTGSKDSLLITEIESTGPSEKVRFQIDKHSCIEAVMKVITDRRRSLSPSNALHGAPPMPTPMSYTTTNNNNAANPQGPPQGPPMPPSAPPPKDNKASTNSEGGGGGRMISEGSSSVNSTNNNSMSTSSHSKPAALDEGLKSQRPNHYHKRSSIHSNADHPPSSGDRDRDRDRERRHSHTTPVQPPRMPRQINNNTRSRSSGDAAMSMPPSMKQPPPPPPNNKEQPPRRSSSGPQQLQMQPPPRPLKRPWKLALAQITGKTLDFSADLPTKTAYLIRTQDQGVVAHVQFFSSPANPSLLEHHPSKRHLQDHFVPLGRLPSHSSQSWKGQEILSFLKHQDERRKTYQPPARRNLPFTHWALLDLEQPLHQAMESTGYFTAAPVNNGSNNNGNNNNNNSNNISFAGKLIWNMHDFYQSSSSSQQQSQQQPLSKLSKWGEVVSAVATSGIRNSPLIATVQGFYELPPTAGNNNNRDHHNKLMPPALRARKVILPKSRTIGIIIGSNAHLSQQQLEANNKNGNAGNNNNGNNQMQVGCCQVLFPNGMASGPPSAQSLKGARAILYD